MSLLSINFLHLTVSKYSPDKILKVKVNTARSTVKSRSHYDNENCTPQQQSYQVSTSYTLQFLRYRPDKCFKGQGHFSKVKGQTMTMHTYTPNQCPHQVTTSYTLWFPRYSPDKILKVKVTAARSNLGHIMMLHTYTP